MYVYKQNEEIVEVCDFIIIKYGSTYLIVEIDKENYGFQKHSCKSNPVIIIIQKLAVNLLVQQFL